ncbi:hypothetical protein Naga_100683g3, partial [Nannochloropsis gaditana]
PDSTPSGTRSWQAREGRSVRVTERNARKGGGGEEGIKRGCEAEVGGSSCIMSVRRPHYSSCVSNPLYIHVLSPINMHEVNIAPLEKGKRDLGSGGWEKGGRGAGRGGEEDLEKCAGRGVFFLPKMARKVRKT